MPEIPGVVIAALAIIAAILIYVIAWRATRASSMAVQSIVRIGLLILIAVPVAGALVVSSKLNKEFENVDSRLASDRPTAAKDQERPVTRQRRRERTETSKAVRETVSRPFKMEAPASRPAAGTPCGMSGRS